MNLSKRAEGSRTAFGIVAGSKVSFARSCGPGGTPGACENASMSTYRLSRESREKWELLPFDLPIKADEKPLPGPIGCFRNPEFWAARPPKSCLSERRICGCPSAEFVIVRSCPGKSAGAEPARIGARQNAGKGWEVKTVTKVARCVSMSASSQGVSEPGLRGVSAPGRIHENLAAEVASPTRG